MRYSYIIVAALIVLAPLALIAASQPSEDQARQAFEQSGCYACHTVHEWDDIVDWVVQSAQVYDSLDAAAQDMGYDSFDALMEEMRQYADLQGGITDEQYQTIYDYLVYLFDVTRAQYATTTTTTTQPPATETATATGTQCPTTTVTETVTKTVTKTETKTEYVVKNESKMIEHTVTRTVPQAQAPSTFKYAPIVAAVLVVLALGYLLRVSMQK